MTRTKPQLRAAVVVLAITLLGLSDVVSGASASPSIPDAETHRLWDPVTGPVPDAHLGRPAVIEADDFRAFRLDHVGMTAVLRLAPRELTRAALRAPLELALPAPDGHLERFTVVASPVMEPGLAARHPDVTTYRGRGLSDPTASIRLSLTPMGFRASVRGQRGSWYIDPYYHLDRSLYVSYFGRDLHNPRGPLIESEEVTGDHDHDHDADALLGALPEALQTTGDVLRTYRLALVSDPTYADYFTPANVTAAKVELINRVRQIYEDEASITLVLIDDNDLLNLDTDDLATGADGPCGSAPCYTEALLASCSTETLQRNRLVVGQIIGASNYDIGHIVMGRGAGGLASLGVVGGDSKTEGCTGIDPPIGDRFAVDFVTHEMGHQFDAEHTFNGTQGSCGRQRSGLNSVEPGSGSSVMAYAGICGDDNLQSNTDPYFSQRTFDQITGYVTSSLPPIDEVQNASLRGFDTDGDSFTLTFDGNTSPSVVRGANYSTAGLQVALTSILPAGATATVAGFGGTGAPSDAGFQVTFGGTLAATNVPSLAITNPSGMSGFVGETAKGGPVDNQGSTVTPTGNAPPVVTTPASFTIPYQTPFTLTGSASDPDGDVVTYLWEQDDPGATAIALHDPAKTTGPLFRQFGTPLDASVYDREVYDSPGLNHPTTDPTRVFPDMAQILANNTNAETGDCPGPDETLVDCYSEFLPTPGYPGPLQFRLTARDGNGGVAGADTTVSLAPGTGPFLVTSPNTAVTWVAGETETVTWDAAGTAAAPVSASHVDILLSSDGGASFPHVLAASTPNDGSDAVTVPAVDTTTARVMVRAAGNIFFDVSNTDFEITSAADMELVSKTASHDPAYAGETLTYTIQVRNNGPSPAGGARVIDVLPAGTSYGSSSVPCVEFPTRRLTCGLGTLDAGDETTLAITALIDRDLVHRAGAPVTITNTATAASDGPDPDPDNNEQTRDTVVKARADLEVVAFEVVAPPAQLLIGEEAAVTLQAQVTNNGPSAPMDVRVVRTATATANATVSPIATTRVEAALGHLEARTLDRQFEVACTEPGSAAFTFTIDLAPDRPDDEDPDLSNNHAETSLVVDCVVPVAVNIEPGSFTNPVNLGKNGEVTVAVLTTEAGEYGLPLAFDATTIDALSARFGPEEVVASGGGGHETHRRGHIEDAIERSDQRTRDGDLDMVLHFRPKQWELTGDETEACVRGRFGPNGFLFHGCDLVTFVPR